MSNRGLVITVVLWGVGTFVSLSLFYWTRGQFSSRLFWGGFAAVLIGTPALVALLWLPNRWMRKWVARRQTQQARQKVA